MIYTYLTLTCIYIEAIRGAAARGVTVKPTGCGFDAYSRRWNIYLNLYFHFFALVSRLSAALSYATQHAMPPEFGRKWGTEYLNTRFPLPTLLYAGYSVKLILPNYFRLTALETPQTRLVTTKFVVRSCLWVKCVSFYRLSNENKIILAWFIH